MSGNLDVARQIIDLMEVPTDSGHGLFVLGSFGTYITLYSQQVRAINLVTALHVTGRLKEDTRVGIVGGGAAGLTAAVCALKLGGKVKLIEKDHLPMYLQRDCAKRYVHPYIYDWPNAESGTDATQLGLLDWKAGPANSVADQIEKAYLQTIRQYSLERYSTCWKADEIKIDGRDESDGSITMTWKQREGAVEPGQFDIVILSVGFGLENRHHPGISRYWEDDAIDKVDGQLKQCIVMGNGDGALTDLIRLCIRDFRHGEIIKLFSTDNEAIEAGRKLLEAEKQFLRTRRTRSDREILSKVYQATKLEKLLETIRKGDFLRDDTKVSLTGRSIWHVFTSRSSILNRLIVSQLNHLGRWSWFGTDIELSPRTSQNGRHVVTKGKVSSEFDIAVLRHGPQPSLESAFPEIWEACDELRKHWKDLSPHDDPTRQRISWSTNVSPGKYEDAERTSLTPGWCRLVAFDLDGTLLRGTDYKWSWQKVWRALKIDDSTRKQLMGRYLSGEIKYDAWCEECANWFRKEGLKRSDFGKITEGLEPVTGYEDTIAELKRNNIRIAIISGGIDTFIEERLPDARTVFDRIYINEFRFDASGVFTGIVPTPFDFQGKLTAIDVLCREFGLQRREVAFVGDGFNDEYIVNQVGEDKIGLTIAFMPQSMVMKENAEQILEKPDLREILKFITRIGDDPNGRTGTNGSTK